MISFICPTPHCPNGELVFLFENPSELILCTECRQLNPGKEITS